MLRDRLRAALVEGVAGLTVNGSDTHRLPHNLHISIPGLESRRVLEALAPRLAVSSGSACSTESLTTSHVLEAIGLPRELAYSALRFGLGRDTTAADVDAAAALVIATITRLRGG